MRDDERDNGLRELAGTWSEAELLAFESATAFFGEVEAELFAPAGVLTSGS